MIAGEHQNVDAIEPRRRVALPVGEEGDQLLEPAETFRRLGQGVLALRHRGARGRMSARQIEADGAQFGEGGEAGHLVFLSRHCELSEAIQSSVPVLDCFVASLLAMTKPWVANIP